MKVFTVWECDDLVGVFDSLEKAKDCIVKILIHDGWKEEEIDFNNFEDDSTEYFSRSYPKLDFGIYEYVLNGIRPYWLK